MNSEGEVNKVIQPEGEEKEVYAINTKEESVQLLPKKSSTNDRPKKFTCETDYALLIVVFACIVILSAFCIAAVVVVVIYVVLSNLDIRVYHEVKFPQNSSCDNGQFYTTQEGFHVLSLNGTNREMGYANGYLLGGMVKSSVDFMVMFFLYDPRKYESALSTVNKRFNHTELFFEELEGFLQGAKDSGFDMYVEILKRNWTFHDLVMLNSLYDWHIPQKKNHIFGANNKFERSCSAVGVSSSYSKDGEPMISRLLDFTFDPKGYDVQALVITVYNNEILAFAYPGQIGVITGFNKHGVWISCNDPHNGRNSFYDYPPTFTPSNLLNRKFLETEKSQGPIHESAKKHFGSHHYLYSFMQMIGNRNHSFVLEQNNQKVATRGENDDVVVLTNHLRVLEPPQYCDRYRRYMKFFDSKDNVTWEDLAYAQDINQQKVPRKCATLLCVQFYPKSLKFRFGLAEIEGKENSWWSVNNFACDDPQFKSTVFSMEDFFFEE